MFTLNKQKITHPFRWHHYYFYFWYLSDQVHWKHVVAIKANLADTLGNITQIQKVLFILDIHGASKSTEEEGLSELFFPISIYS